MLFRFSTTFCNELNLSKTNVVSQYFFFHLFSANNVPVKEVISAYKPKTVRNILESHV